MQKSLFGLGIIIWIVSGLGTVFAQPQDNGIIQGRVFNAKNNEPVPFANIVIWNTTIGSASDLDGRFLFTGIKPGYVELRASSVGFKTYISEPILVTNANRVFIDIPLEETTLKLDEVVVRTSPFRKLEESPLSLRRIGVEEIEKSPGGNRDISRVIQVFPGVASTPAFRNDVIVRGGGSSENRFFLDGVEIPNLNHFATQGASGGPVGIINVDFVREVNFYSSAFPANRGNALSSVLDFRLIDGNPDKLKTRAAIGASDFALTLDGPIGSNTTLIASARRSYLQFLFSALGLPFLPTYNDFQFKIRTKLSEKSDISFIGLGAIDQFRLNLEANETEEQRYILGYLPVNEQWNYTVGAVYRRYGDKGYDTWVLSRNYLNNVAYKYRDNIEVDSLKVFDYSSAEIENKFRYEKNLRTDAGYKINYGLGAEFAKYTNRTFRQGLTGFLEDYDSYLDLFKWSVFGQVSKDYFRERLTLSLGVRADANSYSTEMSNMLDQFSPRFSVSYALTPGVAANFSMGRFFQHPPYTTLGYRDNQGRLVNKQNGIRYIQTDHLVAGIDYIPGNNSKLTIEGFYKDYSQYPFSLFDSIPLASKGADFGTFGDEPVTSTSEGRAYGLEVLYRHKSLLGINMIVSYTLVRSEFEDLGGKYIPTAWDNRHILNVTALRGFKRNWDVGMKWRYVGGAPFTPFDLERSSVATLWDTRGVAFLDYNRYNQLRSGPFHQLDIRVDKQYFFTKWSLMLYLDVQNVYNFKSDEPDRLTRDFDDQTGIPLPPVDDKYPMRVIKSDGAGTVLPTVGIIVEF